MFRILLDNNMQHDAVSLHERGRIDKNTISARTIIKLEIPRSLDAALASDLASIVENLLENSVRAATELCKASPGRAKGLPALRLAMECFSLRCSCA